MPDPTLTPLVAQSALSVAPPEAPPAPDLVRLGHHGALDVVRRVLRLAGRDTATVRISSYDFTDPYWLLRAGELDVLLTEFGEREPDLVTSRVLARDPRAALVGTDHPLARCASVSVEDLAHYPLFGHPALFPADVWDEMVPRHTPSGRPLRREHRFTSVPQMLRLVRAGAAVHLAVQSLSDVAPEGVRVVPVHDLPPAVVKLTWRRGDVPAHVLEFITAAEAGAAQ